MIQTELQVLQITILSSATFSFELSGNGWHNYPVLTSWAVKVFFSVHSQILQSTDMFWPSFDTFDIDLNYTQIHCIFQSCLNHST